MTELTINYNGQPLTVEGNYLPAEPGGLESEPCGDGFEIRLFLDTYWKLWRRPHAKFTKEQVNQIESLCLAQIHDEQAAGRLENAVESAKEREV